MTLRIGVREALSWIWARYKSRQVSQKKTSRKVKYAKRLVQKSHLHVNLRKSQEGDHCEQDPVPWQRFLNKFRFSMSVQFHYLFRFSIKTPSYPILSPDLTHTFLFFCDIFCSLVIVGTRMVKIIVTVDWLREIKFDQMPSSKIPMENPRSLTGNITVTGLIYYKPIAMPMTMGKNLLKTPVAANSCILY